MKLLILYLIQTLILPGLHGFSISPRKPLLHRQKTTDLKSSASSSPSPSPQEQQQLEQQQINFPVLGRISGIEWNGACRYVNAELKPLTNLKLVGGLRYDIVNGTECTLTSFLTFPNGQTREVVMQGSRKASPLSSSPSSHSPLRLDSAAPDGGPIFMLLSEISPDTVIINEVEKTSGKIIMTSSLSLVNGGTELVQISHEVGSGGSTAMVIEGHQVWRLRQVPIEFDDFGSGRIGDTTGR
mmetsp:Transcript_13165/g.19964  ORF Transcript_13165/g.19964 Transcript_13165/m.19964 type:complete len:241 (-) Transcript_13165:396-1118(-)